MANFSSPPAGPLAAGLESDFCRCRLEVLHVFQNFTLARKRRVFLLSATRTALLSTSRVESVGAGCLHGLSREQVKQLAAPESVPESRPRTPVPAHRDPAIF